MTQKLFNELDIIIELNATDEYSLTVTNYSGTTYDGVLTIDHPSVGNITLTDLYICCIRFARTFEGDDYFFATLTYKEQQFDNQLFV
jgi:hypothetical protein